MATYPLRTRRWTRAEYDRLIDVGVFLPDERLELLGGELVVSQPQGSAHYTAIGLVKDALRVAVQPGWLVRSQGPIELDDESEPEPDVAVTPGDRRSYSRRHPSRPSKDRMAKMYITGFDGSRVAMKRVLAGSVIRSVAALPLKKIGETAIDIPANIIEGKTPTSIKRSYSARVQRRVRSG